MLRMRCCWPMYSGGKSWNLQYLRRVRSAGFNETKTTQGSIPVKSPLTMFNHER